MQRLEPSAACFVAPNVSSMRDYRALRGSHALEWQGLSSRQQVAIFVPGDASPQEIRDCLHEETAQALGPLNDLYRLPDSVFNDDNFQSVLTGFDMLMLRLHYAPELTSGMTEAQVAARLPAIVAAAEPRRPVSRRLGFARHAARLGPGREHSPLAPRHPSPRACLQPTGCWPWRRRRAGPTTGFGFAWFALGRLQAPDDPMAAERSYTAAAQIYAGPARRRRASVPCLDAAFRHRPGLGPPRTGDHSSCDQALPLAQRGQNAALLASLKLIKAEALALLGRDDEAAALRLDSLPAARYGFGGERAVRATGGRDCLAGGARLTSRQQGAKNDLDGFHRDRCHCGRCNRAAAWRAQTATRCNMPRALPSPSVWSGSPCRSFLTAWGKPMFLPFFLTLRKTGVPVIPARIPRLSGGACGGLATYDVTAFYHLARTAMVKDERHFDRFDRAFAESFSGLDDHLDR